MSYLHLTAPEREEISRGLAQGSSIRSIAATLHRSPGSISREIRRNAGTLYRALSAHLRAERRAALPRRPRKLILGTSLWQEMERLLRKHWSPDQIAAVLRDTYPEVDMHLSPETIYQAIYILPRGTLRKELIDCLRRSHRYRRKRRYLRQERRGQIPNMVSIHERPEEVESREIPGHWEGDLLIGKYHASAIGTLVERVSRKVLLCRIEGRRSEDVMHAFERRLLPLPATLCRTLTYDRGKEMKAHALLTERTHIKVFFCDPQSPWQRGTNENTNGLVRDFFPKGTDFSLISEEEILQVEQLLNERPRKCLEYRTPDEVFSSYLPVALGS